MSADSDSTALDLLPSVPRIDATHFRDDIPWRLKKEIHNKCGIVLFYADWCGWCTKLKPEFNKLGEKCKSGDLNCEVMAVDIDKCESLITRLKSDDNCPVKIQSWPTMLMYSPDGKIYGKYTGERTVDDLDTTMKAFIREMATDESDE